MYRVLFIAPKDSVPTPNFTTSPFLVNQVETLKLYSENSIDEFALSDAESKLKEIYDNTDYIVYQQTPKITYLSTFWNAFEIFDKYKSPEVGVVYSDYYLAVQGVKRYFYLKNFIPDHFLQHLPPILMVNKKYMPTMPLKLEQQLILHLMNTSPVIHFPESTYILNE